MHLLHLKDHFLSRLLNIPVKSPDIQWHDGLLFFEHDLVKGDLAIFIIIEFFEIRKIFGVLGTIMFISAIIGLFLPQLKNNKEQIGNEDGRDKETELKTLHMHQR